MGTANCTIQMLTKAIRDFQIVSLFNNAQSNYLAKMVPIRSLFHNCKPFPFAVSE